MAGSNEAPAGKQIPDQINRLLETSPRACAQTVPFHTLRVDNETKMLQWLEGDGGKLSLEDPGSSR